MSFITISYESQKVQRLFSDYNAMWKKIGDEKTKRIKKHMDRLKASPTFMSFVKLGLGQPHSLTGDLSGCYAITVTGNTRLIVEPVCEILSPTALAACTEIMVKGVGDYHGEKNEWIIP